MIPAARATGRPPPLAPASRIGHTIARGSPPPRDALAFNFARGGATLIDPLKRWAEYGEKPDYAGLLTFAGMPYTEDPAELASRGLRRSWAVSV